MSDPFLLVCGHDFDTTASNIQVRADRHGAHVFTVEVREPKATVRVLAHCEADAESAAQEFAVVKEEEAAKE